MHLSSLLKAPSGQVIFILSQTNSRNVFLTLLFLQFQLLSNLFSSLVSFYYCYFLPKTTLLDLEDISPNLNLDQLSRFLFVIKLIKHYNILGDFTLNTSFAQRGLDNDIKYDYDLIGHSDMGILKELEEDKTIKNILYFLYKNIQCKYCFFSLVYSGSFFHIFISSLNKYQLQNQYESLKHFIY